MRYLENINTGFIAQHIPYNTADGYAELREQARARSQTYDAVTREAMREFALNSVVATWFDSQYWRIVDEASRFAESNIQAYVRSTHTDANRFLNFINERYPLLASRRTLDGLFDRLDDVFHDGDFTVEEIGDRLIKYANEAYACGVVGARSRWSDDHRGLRAQWRGDEIVHTFKPV